MKEILTSIVVTVLGMWIIILICFIGFFLPLGIIAYFLSEFTK